jgi:hypothetical protein
MGGASTAARGAALASSVPPAGGASADPAARAKLGQCCSGKTTPVLLRLYLWRWTLLSPWLRHRRGHGRLRGCVILVATDGALDMASSVADSEQLAIVGEGDGRFCLQLACVREIRNKLACVRERRKER